MLAEDAIKSAIRDYQSKRAQSANFMPTLGGEASKTTETLTQAVASSIS
jgi:hypothetical protein